MDNSRDVQFVKNLRANLLSRSKSIYALKKAFGHSSREDIKTYMSFLSVCGDSISRFDESVYFTVATMFYNFEKPNQDEQSDRKYVKFESLLSRLYGKSDSTDKKISAFIDSEYDSSGVFMDRFVRLSMRCKKELRAIEHVDFVSLIQDLRSWNDDNKRTKFRWASAIVRIDKEEE